MESSVVSDIEFLGWSAWKTRDAVAHRCDIWNSRMLQASSTELSQHVI